MRQIPLTPEQIAAEFLFEGFYCAAQGWLRDMALLSSSCKIQGPGNCQEISNLMHFHWNSPTLMEPGAPTLSYRCARRQQLRISGFPNLRKEPHLMRWGRKLVQAVFARLELPEDKARSWGSSGHWAARCGNDSVAARGHGARRKNGRSCQLLRASSPQRFSRAPIFLRGSVRAASGGRAS